MVDPHDKTVLARDLQIPDEPEESIFDGEIVVPDLDRMSDPALEELSIPELERLSIPALEPEDLPLGSSPRMPPQAAVPTPHGLIPSLPAGPQQPASRPGSGQRPAASGPRRSPSNANFAAPQSSRQQVPVEFDDEFESFQAGGLSNVQAQMLETVQSPNVVPEVPWPSGNSPDYHTLLVDPLDAQVLANFGPHPKSPLRAPEYAVKVFRRRQELKAELSTTKKRAVDAEARREERLAQLTQACRTREGTERFRHFFSNLEKLEAVAKERQQALAGDNEQFSTEVGKVDQALTDLQARGSALQAALHQHTHKLHEVQQLFARTEAQYKRLLIEIRSLKNAEEEGRIQGKAVDHSTRIQALLAQVEKHQGAVAKRAAERSVAQAQVDAAREEWEQFAEEERRFKKQRGALEKTFRQRLGLRSQGVAETQKELQAEAAQAARALLGQRGGIDIPPGFLHDVRAADEEVLREMKAQRLLEFAVNAHHKETYIQGRNVIVATAVIVLALIVLRMITGAPDGEAEETEDARASNAALWRRT